MLTSRIIAALLLSFTVTTNADAQIGGLIKRTVKEATKPKEEPKDATKATTSEAATFPYELNEGGMAAFKRGLDLEIKMREDYKSKVAKLKTPEQYSACSHDVTNPETMKIMEEYGKLLESAKTPEESQKLMTKLGEQMQAVTLKRCGEDPRTVTSAQYETFKKAEEAGALESAKGWTRTPKPDESNQAPTTEGVPNECLEGDSDLSPLHPVPACSAEAVTIPQQGTNASEEILLDYRKKKEFVEKYCSLSKEMQTTATERGISVPGQGTNIYWVFDKKFAKWVGNDCKELMEKFSRLQ